MRLLVLRALGLGGFLTACPPTGRYEPTEGGHQRADGYRMPEEGEEYDPDVHGPLPAVGDHPAAEGAPCRQCLGTGKVINLGDMLRGDVHGKVIEMPCPRLHAELTSPRNAHERLAAEGVAAGQRMAEGRPIRRVLRPPGERVAPERVPRRSHRERHGLGPGTSRSGTAPGAGPGTPTPRPIRGCSRSPSRRSWWPSRACSRGPAHPLIRC